MQFAQECFVVPVSPRCRAVDHDAEGPHLFQRHVVHGDDRHGVQPQSHRRLEPEVPINEVAGAFGQHGNAEAEFADNGHHARHGIVVFPRVVFVGDKPSDWPLFDSE